MSSDKEPSIIVSAKWLAFAASLYLVYKEFAAHQEKKADFKQSYNYLQKDVEVLKLWRTQVEKEIKELNHQTK